MELDDTLSSERVTNRDEFLLWLQTQQDRFASRVAEPIGESGLVYLPVADSHPGPGPSVVTSRIYNPSEGYLCKERLFKLMDKLTPIEFRLDLKERFPDDRLKVVRDLMLMLEFVKARLIAVSTQGDGTPQTLAGGCEGESGRSRNDERDCWIYQQWNKGTAWKKIRDGIKSHSGWPHVSTLPGIKAAAKRYAKRKNLAPPSHRQSAK